MTIRMPEKTFGDRILKALGKKRGVRIPTGTYEKYGPYAYSTATKENFFRALLRPKDVPLPEGIVDLDSLDQLSATDS